MMAVLLFGIRCWMCDMRGQEVRNDFIMLEMRFGRGMGMLFIFAQMFYLRNGVRAKRQKTGMRGRSFGIVV